jgi:hypothetical protein
MVLSSPTSAGSPIDSFIDILDNSTGVPVTIAAWVAIAVRCVYSLLRRGTDNHNYSCHYAASIQLPEVCRLSSIGQP